MAAIPNALRKATCKNCGQDLPVEHVGCCPSCGKEGKIIKMTIHESLGIKESLNWETRKEYYLKHKGTLRTVIAIAVISPFLGLILVGPVGVIVGLVLGGISYLLGPRALTKVIEKTKGHA
jgi:hypothetical protein